MAKKGTQANKAGARRRAKASSRDLAPRKPARGGGVAPGPASAPRSKWELSELDGVKS
jgi:hypothetical protein